jgi:predicted transcriptional regulator
MSDRQHAHELIDRLPDMQISALVGLLETMIDQEDEELTAADRAAIQAGIDSLDKGRGVPMEDVLADFGLTTADFERMVSEP